MPRRTGALEAQIRELVAAFLQLHGRGAATLLGLEIHRPAAWVGQFARGVRHANIDDAFNIVRVLRERPNLLMAEADRIWAVIVTACRSDEAVH